MTVGAGQGQSWAPTQQVARCNCNQSLVKHSPSFPVMQRGDIILMRVKGREQGDDGIRGGKSIGGQSELEEEEGGGYSQSYPCCVREKTMAKLKGMKRVHEQNGNLFTFPEESFISFLKHQLNICNKETKSFWWQQMRTNKCDDRLT